MPSPYIYRCETRQFRFREGEEDEQGIATADRPGGGRHVGISFTPLAYISIFLSVAISEKSFIHITRFSRRMTQL